MLGCTGSLSGFSALRRRFLSVFCAAFSAAASSTALASNSWVAARVKSSTLALLPAASAASSAACAAAMAAGSRSAEKSGMSSSSTDGAGARPCGTSGRGASSAGAGGSTGRARRMRACRGASGSDVRAGSGAAVCASASVSKRMTPVGSETSGGVAAASRRCSVRCGAAGSGTADCSGCGKLGGLTGAGRSKSSIGSKSAVWSASRVGGVRRRSENRTVLPRLRAASDTTSSGRSWPGRNVMQESVSCRPNKRRRSRSRIWLPMKVSFISGGRAQATAPRRSHTSTKGHCPTLAGM